MEGQEMENNLSQVRPYSLFSKAKWICNIIVFLFIIIGIL